MFPPNEKPPAGRDTFMYDYYTAVDQDFQRYLLPINYLEPAREKEHTIDRRTAANLTSSQERAKKGRDAYV